MAGKFIVLEGIDYSGKTTQAKKLHDYLSSIHDNKVILTKEPTDNHYGKKVRDLVHKGNADPLTFLGLFLQDRRNYVKQISNCLKHNYIVDCDRFKYATYAYQQAQGIPLELMIKLHKNILVPDLTFIIDVSLETVLSRSQDKQEKSSFDKDLDFLRKVRVNYLKLPSQLNENILVIDGNKSIDDVFMSIKQEVNKVL